MVLNKQWILAKRPKDQVLVSDFERKEIELPELSNGEYLVKVEYVSFDPAQRGWMNDRPSYIPPIQIGEVVRAGTVGVITESKNSEFKVGTHVYGGFGWQEYALVKSDGTVVGVNGKVDVRPLPTADDYKIFLSAAGTVGLTAYFGFLRIGQPKEGDVVVVSGAAGATGSLVGQIAKIKGCRVIGIAGGPEKCKWITEELGFDAAIDYKNEDVGKKLKELAPNGINIYFDNVGGTILDDALANMARFGTVVACGGISQYNLSEIAGPKNYFSVVIKSLRVQGFIVFDFIKEYDVGRKALIEWIKEGKLKSKEDVQEGFDNIPSTFLRLFKGENFGKQLLKL